MKKRLRDHSRGIVTFLAKDEIKKKRLVLLGYERNQSFLCRFVDLLLKREIIEVCLQDTLIKYHSLSDLLCCHCLNQR